MDSTSRQVFKIIRNFDFFFSSLTLGKSKSQTEKKSIIDKGANLFFY